jgi:hypothetical protein
MPGAVMIGGPTYTSYRTWASLRTVFGQDQAEFAFNSEYPVMVIGSYDACFKSAAPGSGLIRADVNKVQESSQFNFYVMAENGRLNPSPPPPLIYDWVVRLDWWDYISPSRGFSPTLVPIEVQNQLLGQTVTTFNGVSFNISSALFTGSLITTQGGRQIFLVGSPDDPGPVVSVGKLTPVT